MVKTKKPHVPKPKQYTPDPTLKRAAQRALTQPELISMTSTIKFWSDRNGKYD